MVLNNSSALNRLLNNNNAFRAMTNNSVAMGVIVTKSSILNNLLNNTNNLTMLFDSSVTVNAIVQHSDAFNILLNNTNALNSFRSNVNALRALANNPTGLNYLLNQNRFDYFYGTLSTPLQSLKDSNEAMKTFASSEIGLRKVLANASLRNEFLQKPDAIAIVVKSETARRTILSSNSIATDFFSMTLYNMVQRHWVKRSSQHQVRDQIANVNHAVADPAGLVFCQASKFNGSGSYPVTVAYPTYQGLQPILKLPYVDTDGLKTQITGGNSFMASFNGCTFESRHGNSGIYVEFWTPPE